jgi:hypothetical protein
MAIDWQTGKPRDTDKFSEFPSVFRSNKSSLRSGLESFTFYWNDSKQSGGQLRHSVVTIGAARAFYGPRSEVSDPTRTGTMMIVSDASQALVFNSGSSVCVGTVSSYHAIAAGGTKAYTANQRRVIAFGVEDVGSETDSRISFGLLAGSALTYAAGSTAAELAVHAPSVVAQGSADDGKSGNSYLCTVFDVGPSSFSAYNRYVGPGADPGTGRIIWRSAGTVDLTG